MADQERQARSLISLASIHHIEKAKISAERKAIGLPPEQSLFVNALIIFLYIFSYFIHSYKSSLKTFMFINYNSLGSLGSWLLSKAGSWCVFFFCPCCVRMRAEGISTLFHFRRCNIFGSNKYLYEFFTNLFGQSNAFELLFAR